MAPSGVSPPPGAAHAWRDWLIMGDSVASGMLPDDKALEDKYYGSIFKSQHCMQPTFLAGGTKLKALHGFCYRGSVLSNYTHNAKELENRTKQPACLWQAEARACVLSLPMFCKERISIRVSQNLLQTLRSFLGRSLEELLELVGYFFLFLPCKCRYMSVGLAIQSISKG